MTAALGSTPVVSSWEPSIEDLERGEFRKIVPYVDDTKPNTPFMKFCRLQEEIAALSSGDQKKNAVLLWRLQKNLPAVIRDLTPIREALKKECTAIYQNARSSSLPFVLGGSFLRSSNADAIAIAHNFGILSSEATIACSDVTRHKWSVETVSQTSTKTFKEIPIDLRTGSVLCDKSWSVFKNDCAILGVIHSLRDCYVYKEWDRELTDDLWEESPKALKGSKDPEISIDPRPKILGREIAMLVRAGYVQTFPVPDSSTSKDQVEWSDQIKWSGYHFVCQNKDIASKITLKELQDAVSDLTLDKIQKMLISPKEPPAPPRIASPDSPVAATGGAGTTGSRPGADSPPRTASPDSLVGATGDAGTTGSRPGAGSPLRTDSPFSSVAATGGAGTD